MVTYEDECVGCPAEMGCLGSTCIYRNVPHYFCDKCKDEVYYEDLYYYDGKEICEDCLLKLVPKAY